MTSPVRVLVPCLAAVILLATSCATEPAGSGDAPATVTESTASPVAPSEATPGSPAGPISGPCDLLTAEQITATVGVVLGEGEETIDEARQVQTCSWAADDMTTIVVVGLTDVAADEAYQTNVDLAPAYFEGEAVETTVPGATRAYAVQQPDVGWVVGAIADDRFVQVQVGGTDITQDMASALAADAIARLGS